LLTDDQKLYLSRVIVLATPYNEYDLDEINKGRYNPAKELGLPEARYEQLKSQNSPYVALANAGLKVLISNLESAPRFLKFFKDEIHHSPELQNWHLVHMLEEEGPVENWWTSNLSDTAYAFMRDSGLSSASADSAFEEMEEELIENIPEERFREIQVQVFAAMQGATF
jgi:hypothetical protein